MPLPFLTADRAPDAPRGEALPHAAQDHWRRPYRPGSMRVGIAAVLLLLASYILFSALIIALAGTPAGASATVGLAALTIVFALRLLRIGVWVSPRGLRQVSLLTTRTVRWRDVGRVSTVQQPVRWVGLPRTVQGQALLIERRRGEPLRTLLTDHNSDFLRRPDAFERAADLIEAWAAEHR
ncbi:MULTISPECIES: hypothetical protein [Streptomyces]|uniref:hypothetical protein n=1 Tax=Streptomyces TaxID=1883 RepID=UPI000CD4BDA0|nr:MULTISPECIES: hypothetical protein [Streptomyces]